MAELKKVETKVEVLAVISLNERELLALDALAGYGIDCFLETFYERLGRGYLEPYEDGLRSFMETVRGCSGLASEAAECREFLFQAKELRIKALRTRRAEGGESWLSEIHGLTRGRETSSALNTNAAFSREKSAERKIP